MLALERRGLDEDRTLVESMTTIEGTGQMTIGEWSLRRLIPKATALRSDPKGSTCRVLSAMTNSAIYHAFLHCGESGRCFFEVV